jgi:hypothetical protein
MQKNTRLENVLLMLLFWLLAQLRLDQKNMSYHRHNIVVGNSTRLPATDNLG